LINSTVKVYFFKEKTILTALKKLFFLDNCDMTGHDYVGKVMLSFRNSSIIKYNLK